MLLPFDYAVRNLARSPARLAFLVLGSALVVGLALATGSFVRGMSFSLRSSGEAANVILLGAGSEESIERSEISASVAGLVAASLPGIRYRAGVPYVSAEVHVQLPLRAAGGDEDAPLVLIRGVTPGALLVHSTVQIAEGRMPRAGANEVMVGAMTATKMGVADGALAVGATALVDDRPWTIVGRFVAPGTVYEAEVWTPLTDLKEATKRETDSCVTITLDPARAEFADVAAFAQTRVDLELSAMPETEYYASLAAFFAPIRVVAWVTAGLVGLGGLLGGLNTMYAAFASRVRELGTLQSMGFRRGAIVVSLAQESVLACTVGALLACGAGLFLLDGLAVRFSMGAFGLRIDGPVLGIAMASGVGLGLLGALPPAWRCLRLAIPLALKAV